jgi:lauroyl/myristoyl acyltransferase
MVQGDCTNRVTLHIRDQAAQASSLWSHDDTRFLIATPFLLGAATLCPTNQSHRSARLIESISYRTRRPKNPNRRELTVAERLGTTSDSLGQIVAESRVNQTEHMIHVINSLLRRNWRPRFEITGRQFLDQALADGQGVVLWVAHFSFSSLFTKMALSEAGYKLSHISRPEHGVSKSRFGIKCLNWFRCRAENRYLQHRIVHRRREPEATKSAALAVLARNELLSVTVGSWEGRQLATGALLGSRYTISTGAPSLAFQGGAKLLSVFTTRNNNDGCYNIAIGAPLGEALRSSRDAFVYASTLELLSRHETAIREAPEQWRGWSKILD